MQKLNSAVFVSALLLVSATSFAAVYDVDADHSSVNFKIRHLVTKVHGKFDKFKGTVNYDKANPKTCRADITIETASIDTGVTKRDEHLRSPDFFDVAKYPEIHFVSTGGLSDVTDTTAKLKGNLTMHGVTKPVVLNVELGGTGEAFGTQKIGFDATTKVNRKDFGLNWNKKIESGGLLVGDEVEINIDVEANAHKDASAK